VTVWNLGSINIDHFYRLPHLPQPGETLAAVDYMRGLGGKGANQSVAAQRAGARVVHMGAVGAQDGWSLGELARLGVGTDAVLRVDSPTGHAIVCTDAQGENLIVIHPGANRAMPLSVLQPLSGAVPGDTLLLQNETAWQVQGAQAARAAGLRVMYSAAPFDLGALRAVLPHATHLLMNAVEADALAQSSGTGLADLPVQAVVVTRGAQGADWIASDGTIHVPAVRVTPVDTTGAGDCFAGSLAARLDAGDDIRAAMTYAAAAAALQVTKPGTAEAMPDHAAVQALLAGR
jgi:ribokinase